MARLPIAKNPGHSMVAGLLAVLDDNILPTDMGKSPTQQDFDAMYAGKTRTKFKMLVDPATKKVYWLMRPDRGHKLPYVEGESPYKEIEIRPTTIYSYRLKDDKKAEYARPPEPLGGDFHIDTMTLQSDSQRDPATELSWRQVYELDAMIAGQSHWWPLEGLAWKAREYFARTIFYVLFDGKLPIGLAATEAEQTRDNLCITITMIGLLDGYKGQGFGKKLLRYVMYQALKENRANEILLYTSDQDRQHGRATKEWYEKLGFEKIREEINDPAAVIAAAVEAGELGDVDLFNSYISDVYSKNSNGETAERYTQKAITRRLQDVFS